MLWLHSFFGLFLLLLSGDFLVRGAIQLSNRLRVSALLVSLTVVAFGTSAPELIVAIKATLSGSPGLALGNVVGSNIANILLVLGLPTLLVGLKNDIADTNTPTIREEVTRSLKIKVAAMPPLGAASE